MTRYAWFGEGGGCGRAHGNDGVTKVGDRVLIKRGGNGTEPVACVLTDKSACESLFIRPRDSGTKPVDFCPTVVRRSRRRHVRRMEASADWPSLQKRGFLVVKQFLSADQCAELAECYQTLPAATDSIGFGVRWALKHVAQPLALPPHPSLRSPCNLALGCSAQQGEWARSQ